LGQWRARNVSDALVDASAYHPSASALSGDSVTITVDAASTAVCTITTGQVSYQHAGTCTLDFNDPGNASYAPAAQLQQTFAVTAIRPSAPGRPKVKPHNKSVRVSWTPPATNGGATITKYTVTAFPGKRVCTRHGKHHRCTVTHRTCKTSGTLQCTVKHLHNGKQYRFTVTATTTAGKSPASPDSQTVTPHSKPHR
jgi:hypothetical protein